MSAVRTVPCPTEMTSTWGVINLGDTEANCCNGVVLVLKWGAGAADNWFIK